MSKANNSKGRKIGRHEYFTSGNCHSKYFDIFFHFFYKQTKICSGFRTIRTGRRDVRNPCRGIVDGDLGAVYTDLPATEQAELARKIGTTAPEILDDLAELDRSAAHY